MKWTIIEVVVRQSKRLWVSWGLLHYPTELSIHALDMLIDLDLYDLAALFNTLLTININPLRTTPARLKPLSLPFIHMVSTYTGVWIVDCL